MSSGFTRPIGRALLREWRERRRLSQLALALEAEVSTRHLSFLESGRARPSREMVLRLAERLDVPLRERNMMLLAAGFAPPPRARSRRPRAGSGQGGDRPRAGRARTVPRARDRPLLDAGRRQPRRTGAADRCVPELLQPPINVLRLSLHPNGLAHRSRITPSGESSPGAIVPPGRADRRSAAIGSAPGAAWLCQGSRHVRTSIDPFRTRAWHRGDAAPSPHRARHAFVDQHHDDLRTPVDVTLSELAIEAFFPADAATATCCNASCRRKRDVRAVTNDCSCRESGLSHSGGESHERIC